MKALELPLLKSYDQDNFFILAGPCVVEGKDICRQIASTVAGDISHIPNMNSHS